MAQQPFGQILGVIADAGGGVNYRTPGKPWPGRRNPKAGAVTRVQAIWRTTVNEVATIRSGLVLQEIVFAKIGAGLDGDQDQGQAAGVLQPVKSAQGDRDRLAFRDEPDSVPQGHPSGPPDHHPMFRSMQMRPHGQHLARLKLDPPDPEAVAAIKRFSLGP